MIISFAKTIEPLLSARKDTTRRVWSDKTFNTIAAQYDRGQVEHKAYDKSPRFGGKAIGIITLKEPPIRERLDAILKYPNPMAELEREGGLWCCPFHFTLIFKVHKSVLLTVLRFNFKPLQQCPNRLI